MRREPGGTFLWALLLVAVAVVAANTYLAFRSVNVLLTSEFWVQHTLEVSNAVELMMNSAKDAETATRGFLLTGREDYLAPYTKAQKELPGELDRFGVLTSDNPVQVRNLEAMRSLVGRRLNLLGDAVERRRESDRTKQPLVLKMQGYTVMDQLRQRADLMEGEEQRLLARREQDAGTSVRRARETIGLASALDFLLLVLMFRYLGKERARRLEMERAAERLAAAQREAERNAVVAKAAADEVLLLNATLEERVRLRTMELETTNRELEAFSYSVSHDLRAPLRTIDGFSLALEEDYAGAVDEVGRDYILRVRTGVQRMGQLIDALLQLSRITRAELTREEFDLSAVANDVVADLQLEDGAGTAKVRFTIEQGLRATADPKLLRVALENLLGNAVKFSSKLERPVVQFGWDEAALAPVEEGGEASRPGAWFVRDNGAGFDMYYAAKLFNAFNRLHGDKDFKGSGIGLATVARVVRRHHGKIWADSVVDHGATFWFTLG